MHALCVWSRYDGGLCMYALCVVRVWWAVCAYIVCGPGMVGCVCMHCVWSRYDGGLCVHALCVVWAHHWWVPPNVMLSYPVDHAQVK